MSEVEVIHNPNSLIGHQGRCFDLRFFNQNNDSQENLLLSASEDGTAKLWNTKEKKCLQTFQHNKSSEVLRANFLCLPDGTSDKLCTAGSDGKAVIWKYGPEEKPSVVHNISHQSEESQIYVCETNPAEPQHLLTAADNHLYLWDIEHSSYSKAHNWEFFVSDEKGTHFGGSERNPNAESYVFDAKWSPDTPNLLTVILSDNTMKLIDIRTKEAISLSFPVEVYSEEQSNSVKLGHPTWLSFHLENQNQYCSVSFGSGHIGLFDFRKMELMSMVHLHHRPSYGNIFLSSSSSSSSSSPLSLLSWASDATICHWDYSREGEGTVSINSYYRLPQFSPLVCAQSPTSFNCLFCGGESKNEGNSHQKVFSFVGTPIYMIELPSPPLPK